MHPIANKQFAFTFSLLWACVIAAHFSVLYFFYSYSLQYSIADSLIYNILFAFISLGIWYMIAYAGFGKQRFPEAIISHLSAAAFSIFVWILFGNFIEGFVVNEVVPRPENIIVIRAFSGMLYYGIMILVYSLIRNYNELKQKAEEKAELTSMLKEAEISVLKAQIKPHFLFNSLNSISALTMTDAAKAHEMIIKLSEFMRYSLQNNAEQLTTLEKELYHISLYLDIEKVRFAEKLELAITSSPECSLLKLPSLILQPLAENAIKYGVYQSVEKVRLSLDCSSIPGYLIVKVNNDYDAEAIPKKGTGTGLKNVADRLSIIYGRKDLMEISSNGAVFEVILKIPQHEKDQNTNR